MVKMTWIENTFYTTKVYMIHNVELKINGHRLLYPPDPIKLLDRRSIKHALLNTFIVKYM